MPEKQNEEYKQSWHENYLKQICSFANSQGGKLYIGIDDNGNIVGVSNYEDLLELLPNKIRDKMGITAEVNLLESEGKYYIEILTNPSDVAISIDGRYYIRSGSTTRELTGNSLNEFLLSKSGRTWDDVIESRATIDDIDDNSFNLFIESAKTTGRLPDIKGLSKEEILEKLRLVEDGKLKRAALVLFGKDPGKFYPSLFVKIGRFGKTDDDLLYQEVIEGNIITILNTIITQLNSKFLIRPISYQGLQRIEKNQYPVEALREMFLNALVHRSYLGSATLISVYDDKLMTWNDGALPIGFSINTLKNKHISKPRNPIIADICFRAGYIESWGRGTLKILTVCKEAGLPEPLFEEKDGGLIVTLFNGLDISAGTGEGTAGTGEGTNLKPNKTEGVDGEGTAGDREGTDIVRLIINSEFLLKDTALKDKLYILLKAIIKDEGKRVADYKDLTDIKAKTLERYISQLKNAGLITFKGANQFGGYYLTDKTKAFLK